MLGAVEFGVHWILKQSRCLPQELQGWDTIIDIGMECLWSRMTRVQWKGSE